MTNTSVRARQNYTPTLPPPSDAALGRPASKYRYCTGIWTPVDQGPYQPVFVTINTGTVLAEKSYWHTPKDNMNFQLSKQIQRFKIAKSVVTWPLKSLQHLMISHVL